MTELTHGPRWTWTESLQWKSRSLPLRLSGTFPMVPLEMRGTVPCQGRDHQPRYRRQIYGITVSLCAFKVSSYGCGEPGAPFQQGGKDRGKGQSMRHNDLILSHAEMRYCSLTCWEEDKEYHTHLSETSIWTIKLEYLNASSPGFVVMLVVPRKRSQSEPRSLFFLFFVFATPLPGDTRAWDEGVFQSELCVCLLFIMPWDELPLIVALVKKGRPLCLIPPLPVSPSVATACVYIRRSTLGRLMNQENVFRPWLSL